MNLLARPSDWARTGARPASGTPFAGGPQHYFAFFSYSHRDEAIAQWLHDELEKFRVPAHLVGRITEHGAVPRRLTPIFRDLKELPASDDLGSEIRSALAASRFLVVLCSPAAAESKWTNAEIDAFKRVRPEGCILAAVVAGEPFASDMPGREQEECLPRALRFKYDRRGRPTSKRAEPLAADLRQTGEARRLGFLKLVAGMLGVGLDDLVQRDQVRRQRRLAILTAASIAGMVVASGLAWTAFDARDAARDQRREAESLVGFMLGDLRAKLEPLGRLDVLDSVGSRAFEYYQQQDKSSLSDESLAQRSKALTLMGEIANTRGDLGRALQLYREAYAGTAEALRRAPANPERMFDHAQNVFWVGYIARQQGNLPAAERSFREYKRLADGMIAIEPTNSKWRLEGKYAENNLGVVLLDQNRYSEAATAFQRALASVEALAASEPQKVEHQKSLLEALAWLADARTGEGRLDDALAQRERQLALLSKLIAASPDDKDYARRAMPAEQAMSQLLAARGETASALAHARRATDYAATLMRTEPNNMEWTEFAAWSQFNLARLLSSAKDAPGASAATRSGCAMVDRLLARDSSVRSWNEDLRLQCLLRRSRIALAGNAPDEGLVFARQALAVATGRPDDPGVAARVNRARAYQAYADALAAAGNAGDARRAWTESARAWPTNVTLDPYLLAQQWRSLRFSGDLEGARRIAARLESIGYREIEYRREAGGAGA